MEKIKLIVEKNTNFITDDLEIFKGLDIENLTKENVQKEAAIYDVDPRDIVLESLYLKGLTPSDISRAENYMLTEILRDINPIDFGTVYSIENLLRNYSEKDRQGVINNYKKDYNKIIDLQKNCKKWNSDFQITNFIQDAKEIYYIYRYADPYEIFNSIEPSKNIPFIELNILNKKVYKIFKESNVDIAIADILTESNVNNVSISITILYIQENFQTTVLLIWESSKIHLKFDIDLDDKNGENIILGSIKYPLHKESEKQGGIRGSFAVPNLVLNRDIFMDLIMNNTNLDLFSVDESAKVGGRTKEGFSSIYLQFEPENMNVYISMKKSGRKDPFVITKQVPLFSDYVNVRIPRAKNLSQVNRYKTIFQCLLSAYKSEFNKITNEYAKILPKYKNLKYEESDEGKDERNIKLLQRSAPDIFIQGYTKKVAGKMQPSVYDEELYGEIAENDPDRIMKFNDDLTLVCANDDFKYPGIFVNNLENKEEYPFLPKCYITKNKNYLDWKKWETNRDFQIERAEAVLTTKVTEKALELNKKGLLPRNIWYILGKNKNYYRSGTPFDVNSFIHAVLQAVDKDYVKSDNKSEYAWNIRRGFIGKKFAIQELWDKQESDIDQDLLNENVEFDSKLFIGFLEKLFNIKIYVMIRDSQDKNATFEIPRYTQGYLDNNFPRSMIVYKHMGIYGQHLKSYHYELIRDPTKTTFNSDKTLARNLKKWFNMSYKLNYSSSVSISQEDKSSLRTLKPDSEIVDNYGKTRILNFDSYKISAYVAPVAPISPGNNIVELLNICPASKLKNVMKFIEDNNLKLVYKDVENNKIIGLWLGNGNENVYIKIRENFNDLDLPIKKFYGEVSTSDNSLLKTFNNRKIADFMTQFAMYHFSKNIEPYVPESSDSLSETLLKSNKWYEKNLRSYMKTIIIESNINYLKNLPRELTTNNNFFKDNRLILDSETTKEKIEWILYYSINNDLENLLDYKNKEYLTNYYILPEDYKQYPNTIILIGENSFIDWIKSDKIDRRIVEIPDKYVKTPQFWKNWVFGNKIFIIQNVEKFELENALHVAKVYKESKINLGYDAKEDKKAIEKNYNVIRMKNGVLLSKNYDENKLTVYRYDKKSYAAVLELDS